MPARAPGPSLSSGRPLRAIARFARERATARWLAPQDEEIGKCAAGTHRHSGARDLRGNQHGDDGDGGRQRDATLTRRGAGDVAVGECRGAVRSPVMRLNSVDLPAPFGPIMPKSRWLAPAQGAAYVRLSNEGSHPMTLTACGNPVNRVAPAPRQTRRPRPADDARKRRKGHGAGQAG
jgi:hypothetical protein